MLVLCHENNGEARPIHDYELVSKASWLSGAKLVPPKNLVDEFFKDGVVRYDYWREVSWQPFALSDEQYRSIVSNLVDMHGFVLSDFSNSNQSRIFWKCVQTSEQTGRPIEEVRQIVYRLDVLERMKSILMDLDDDVEVDEELSVFIASKMNDEIEKLGEIVPREKK